MKGKLLVLAGAAVGYVFGTKAGRERYEQIKDRTAALWHDPHVQRTVHRIEDGVKDTAAEVQEKVTEAVKDASSSAASFVQRNDHRDNGRPDDARPDNAELPRD